MMDEARRYVRRILTMGKARRREGAQGVQFSRLYTNMSVRPYQFEPLKMY